MTHSAHVTWSQFYRDWRRGVAGRQELPAPLFLDLAIFSENHHGGRLAWWPVKEIRQNHEDAQRNALVFSPRWDPAAVGSPLSKGESETLEYLWREREDPERVCAVLTLATLHRSLDNCRKARYPDRWLPFDEALRVQSMAMRRIDGRLFYHHWITDALPYTYYDDWRAAPEELPLRTIRAMAYHFGHHHARVLSAYRPISITIDKTGDPELLVPLREKLLFEARQRKADEARRQAEYHRRQREEREYTEKMKKAHPRYGQWDSVTKEELSELVWSQATTAVAWEFGVSDIAVAKKCRKFRIAKPPRGYWAKMYAGKAVDAS